MKSISSGKSFVRIGRLQIGVKEIRPSDGL